MKLIWPLLVLILAAVGTVAYGFRTGAIRMTLTSGPGEEPGEP